MADGNRGEAPRPDHVDHLVSISASLSGTCLAGAALIRLKMAASLAVIAHDLLAVAALVFLAATILAYAAIRLRRARLRPVAEAAFGVASVLLGLVLLALAAEAL